MRCGVITVPQIKKSNEEAQELDTTIHKYETAFNAIIVRPALQPFTSCATANLPCVNSGTHLKEGCSRLLGGLFSGS